MNAGSKRVGGSVLSPMIGVRSPRSIWAWFSRPRADVPRSGAATARTIASGAGTNIAAHGIALAAANRAARSLGGNAAGFARVVW